MSKNTKLSKVSPLTVLIPNELNMLVLKNDHVKKKKKRNLKSFIAEKYKLSFLTNIDQCLLEQK